MSKWTARKRNLLTLGWRIDEREGEQIKSDKVRRKIFIIYHFQEKKNKKGGKRRGNV